MVLKFNFYYMLRFCFFFLFFLTNTNMFCVCEWSYWLLKIQHFPSQE